MKTISDEQERQVAALLTSTAADWSDDFTVPDPPVLPPASVEGELPGRATRRWVRPTMIAASIVAVLVATTVALNRPSPPTARPDPSTSAPSAPESTPAVSTAGGIPASPTPRSWPEDPTAQTLVISEGEPPPTITVRGVLLTRDTFDFTVPILAVDSNNPNVLQTALNSDPDGSCGWYYELFLHRDAGVVTVTVAGYHRDVVEVCAFGAVINPRPARGVAPFRIADAAFVDGSTGKRISAFDLADCPPPTEVTKGYSLDPHYSVASDPDGGIHLTRWLRPDDSTSQNRITLFWGPTPMTSTAGRLCALRKLSVGSTVSACTSTVDPRHVVPSSAAPTVPSIGGSFVGTDVLQDIVDSIP